MVKFGLVTVLYKSDSVLEDFFESLSIQTYQNFKLYLIDNSKNDETDKLLFELYNKYTNIECTYIDAKGNIGVAAGNNLGINKSIADGCTHTIILNNDIVIEQIDLFQKLAVLGLTYKIIVPKIYYPDKNTLWFDGGYFDSLRSLGVHSNFNKQDKFTSTEYFITYSPTCFMSIDNNVFKDVGIMDERYFVYIDDTDFVFRCTNLGIQPRYIPQLEIIHKVSVSSGGDNSIFYIYYANRNKIYFIRKHYSSLLQIVSIGYHIMARSIYYLKFDNAQRKALIKGIKDGFKITIILITSYITIFQ